MSHLNPRVVKAIHACRRKVAGLEDEDAWRAFLSNAAGVASLRAMDGRQLGKVLDELHRKGAPRVKARGHPDTPLGRAIRASAPSAAEADQAQARIRAEVAALEAAGDRGQHAVIRALWRELGRMGALRDPHWETEAGIDRFVHRQTGIATLRWLPPAEANKVVEGLKAWLARERRKKNPRPPAGEGAERSEAGEGVVRTGAMPDHV